MQIDVFCTVKSCSLVPVYRRFGRSCRLRHEGRLMSRTRKSAFGYSCLKQRHHKIATGNAMSTVLILMSVLLLQNDATQILPFPHRLLKHGGSSTCYFAPRRGTPEEQSRVPHTNAIVWESKYSVTWSWFSSSNALKVFFYPSLVLSIILPSLALTKSV